jgi:hypothetical protein
MDGSLGRAVPRRMSLLLLPSCTHPNPHTVQKARRLGLTMITIRGDWQTGHSGILADSRPSLSSIDGIPTLIGRVSTGTAELTNGVTPLAERGQALRHPPALASVTPGSPGSLQTVGLDST